MRKPFPKPSETVVVGRGLQSCSPDMECPPFVKQDGRIRACIIANGIHIGGAERWIHEVLKSTSHDVIQWVGVGVLIGVDYQDFADKIRSICPIYVGRDAMKMLAAECDCVVSWFFPDMEDFKPRLGGPVVSVSHSPPECRWAFDRFSVSDLKGVTDIVAVSDSAVNCYPEKMRDRVRVIKNAVNPDSMIPGMSREEVRRSWGVGADEKVIGYVGRLGPEKGVRRVWEAVINLPDEWRAVIIGSGHGSEDVREHARIEAGGRAVFPGATGDVASAMLGLDYLIVPSDYESFGYVIAEAWHLGVPVICTPVGVALDHPDLVQFVQPHPHGIDIANAVLTDEAHPEMVRDRADRAKKVVADLYNSSRFGSEWTHYLASLAVDWFSKRRRAHAA